MNEVNFSKKVAVITGGASGIGRAMAEALIARGAQVVIADIQADALTQAATEIGATGIQTDVSSSDSVAALAAAVQERFGKVDIVCNNAGVCSIGRIADLRLNDWRWIINVNLFGVIHGVEHFLPLLEGNPEGGFFLNTASVSGFVAGQGFGPYTVSKFGVVALTETLALELGAAGSKVGAGILIPGPVHSNIGQSNRNRPASLGDSGFVEITLEELSGGAPVPWIDPAEVAALALRAIGRRDLYTTSHPAYLSQIKQRHAAIASACFPD